MINHNSLNRLDIAILINITLARNVSKDTIKRVIITSDNDKYDYQIQNMFNFIQCNPQ